MQGAVTRSCRRVRPRCARRTSIRGRLVHLRGTFHNEAYKKLLGDLINDLNLTEKIFFHEPILAEDIIKNAAQFDVGLALEPGKDLNNQLIISHPLAKTPDISIEKKTLSIIFDKNSRRKIYP